MTAPLRPNAMVIVTCLLLAAGCDKTTKIPRIDQSQSSGYVATDFKDDAPANATVTSDLPLSFVDSNGNPVDLTQYRGKKKVVLIVLRGMPQSPGGVFCPSCLAQTSSLFANQEQFARRG